MRRLNLDDSNLGFSLNSSWKKRGESTSEIGLQTQSSFNEAVDAVTQTGTQIEIIQDQITKRDEGITLIEKVKSLMPSYNKDILLSFIHNGAVLLDDEVITDENKVCHIDSFIECSAIKRDSTVSNIPLSIVFIIYHY